MFHFAQNNPCYLIIPGFPISIKVVDNKIVTQSCHFALGSKFQNEKIGNFYYLKYRDSYISFVDKIPVVVDEIVFLDDLVYIEPYFNGIFHLKHKSDYVNLSMEFISMNRPIKFQWVKFGTCQSYKRLDVLMNIYKFLEPYQFEYVSVEGFDLLNSNKSFLFIPDGDFNMRLNYRDYIFKFRCLECNNLTELMFINKDGNITAYSKEFGFLQAKYDEDNQRYYPVFSHDQYGCSIILEQANLYSTYYLKYESLYVKLIKLNNIYHGILIDNKDEASIFQAISNS